PVLAGVDAEGGLVISSRETAVKGRNARRGPRGAVCVVSDGLFGQWIQGEGAPEIVPLPGAMGALVASYRDTSGEHPDWDDYRETMVREKRVIMRIPPERAGPDSHG